MKRREGCRARCVEQPGLTDGQGVGVGRGRQAGQVTFWNHSLGWQPLEKDWNWWGGKGTKFHTAVPSSR